MGYDDSLATKKNIDHYVKEFKNNTDVALRTHVINNPRTSTGIAAAHLLNRRKSKIETKRHIQIIIVCAISAIAACIAAYPVVFPPPEAKPAAATDSSMTKEAPVLPVSSSLPQQKQHKKTYKVSLPKE